MRKKVTDNGRYTCQDCEKSTGVLYYSKAIKKWLCEKCEFIDNKKEIKSNEK